MRWSSSPQRSLPRLPAFPPSSGRPPLPRRALERLHASWQSAALASVAAALAWLIAHRVLDHPAPFFAPIAAAVALSTSQTQRSRRIVQLVGGVVLGIGVGELLASTIGTTTTALGVIVFITFALARLSGISFVGEGMMFANQAAASAILVVTLHRHGTGSERVVDALVGGALGLILGVVMFPAHPLLLLHRAERSVLRTLADLLSEALARTHPRPLPDEGFALSAGYTIHRQLAMLAQARSTARTNVRVAPRRWRMRPAVDRENERTARLDLLADAVLGLVRTLAVQTKPPTEELTRHVHGLQAVLAELAGTSQPWSDAQLGEVRAVAEEAICFADRAGISGELSVAAVLAAAAGDLNALVGRRG
jgi:uncharacterized membrane protein YgaE (UPF0421/DUF939 family)